MRKILESILQMPYFRNYQAASGAVHNTSTHESAVEDVLCAFGFSEVEDHDTKGFIKTRDLWINDPAACDMENGTYISQPCGPQNSPDFIVKADDKVYFMECKSSAQKYPTLITSFSCLVFLVIFSKTGVNFFENFLELIK